MVGSLLGGRSVRVCCGRHERQRVLRIEMEIAVCSDSDFSIRHEANVATFVILVEMGMSISLDFVIGLPTTQKRHDAIWVVVDRLTKSAHLLPIRKNYGISKLGYFSTEKFVRLHGTPTILCPTESEVSSHFGKDYRRLGELVISSLDSHPRLLIEKVAVAKEKLKEVSPFRGVKRFGISRASSVLRSWSFEILERIGEVCNALLFSAVMRSR
ncbi:retrotransposon protein, putative, ty3-gypsy subclass [Tanacetum coccineum]